MKINTNVVLDAVSQQNLLVSFPFELALSVKFVWFYPSEQEAFTAEIDMNRRYHPAGYSTRTVVTRSVILGGWLLVGSRSNSCD